MAARKEFREWFAKNFPQYCIDGEFGAGALAAWNALEEKFTSTNSRSMPVTCKCEWCGKPFKEGDVLVCDEFLTGVMGYRYCSDECRTSHINSK
jgi:hypothetical protein